MSKWVRHYGLVYFSLTRARVKKGTLKTRGCSFGVPLNMRGPYTQAKRCTQRYKSTYTHWKGVIHSARTMPGPLFLENTEIRYRFALISCSVCFFLISQPRVSGPKSEHESFFLGRWSRVCGWRICEKQKKPPLRVHMLPWAKFRAFLPNISPPRLRI